MCWWLVLVVLLPSLVRRKDIQSTTMHVSNTIAFLVSLLLSGPEPDVIIDKTRVCPVCAVFFLFGGRCFRRWAWGNENESPTLPFCGEIRLPRYGWK